ncbi:peptidoglycan-associated lipoprotein Pal [Caenimonas koreensis]|uniref:Peptidoglycan-associated lipoprotein n=1 Tax=Caenimonas koreensis DSM 17982 TaxID=1121255 RepID=A0A844B2M4_9BURK|nr:peptidoglycan-associated lipoprotein Pal [Caenimonas koreensis]MRD47512.1 peptidoglycan-associated lipoprotein Pal [Caenimonas koreensis DSM 17982]
MKPAHFALLLSTTVLLAACSSTPNMNSATNMAPVAQAPVQSPQSKPVPSKTAVAPLPAYLDPGNPVSIERSVYFDFDDTTVKKEYFAVVELQGKYLASNPRLNVRIEGNTDERGSAEYNLALGQKRAEAVLRALRVHGVSASQMEAISWGSEKPKAAGHDEGAWSQNRRADVDYPTR